MKEGIRENVNKEGISADEDSNRKRKNGLVLQVQCDSVFLSFFLPFSYLFLSFWVRFCQAIYLSVSIYLSLYINLSISMSFYLYLSIYI